MGKGRRLSTPHPTHPIFLLPPQTTPTPKKNKKTNRTPDLTVLWEPTNIAALVYTGVITSALAVVAESVALAHVTAEETTVILR